MSSRDPDRAVDGLHLDIRGSVATLWFDRSERRNALAKRHWDAIPSLIEGIDEAPSVRVLVLRGSEGSFCAGADISEFRTERAAGKPAAAYEDANEAAFGAVRFCSIPTIAALEGAVFGGGFGLAAACDLRIAESGTRFAIPAGKLGLAYPLEAMADIVAAVGVNGAKQMLLTGGTFDADTMLRWGMLAEVVPVEEMDRALAELTAKIVGLAPSTLQAAKAVIDGRRLADAELLERAKRLGAATFASEDYAEGLRAFEQKRPPRFTGR